MRAFFLAIALVALTLHGPKVYAQPFAKLIVFGDSHSDTGNWAEVTEWPLDPAYLVGRFSNGPIWVEEFAAQLELPLPTPSESGGLNYAWGGARTGHGYDSAGGVPFPKVGTQVDQYLGSHVPDGNELVTLFAGSNDFGWGREGNPSIPVLNIADDISALATAGIRYVFVPSLPPLGHSPEYRGTDREATLNTVIAGFNELLSTELGRLESDLGVTIFQSDFSRLVQDAIEAPASFGLVNVTDPALSNGVVVPNPNEYLYWDENHFSAAFYKVMGQRAATVLVPEPASLLLLAMGCAAIGVFLARPIRGSNPHLRIEGPLSCR